MLVTGTIRRARAISGAGIIGSAWAMEMASTIHYARATARREHHKTSARATLEASIKSDARATMLTSII